MKWIPSTTNFGFSDLVGTCIAPVSKETAVKVILYVSFFYREVNTRFEIRQKEEFQDRKEKSTRILVAIILVFVVCHIFRLSIQVRLFKVKII